MFPSWCRKLVQLVLNNNTRGQTRRLTPLGSPRRFCHPRLEQFEDRIVPTTVSIPTNLTGVRGGIVTVPINVDILSDPAHGTSGLSSGNFIVYYNPAVFSVSNTDVNLGTIATPTAADPTGTGVGDGYSPSNPNGWGVAPLAYIPGYLNIGLGNPLTGIITNTGGGSLVTINFHIASNAPLGPTAIDLAADSFGSPPSTYLNDQNFTAYALGPNGLGPQDNTTFNPYTYTGSDPDDGSVVITAATPAPDHLVISAPSTAATGTPFQFIVKAENQSNSTDASYSGTVQFTSSDGAATLPVSSTLTAGTGSFSATFRTLGSQTLTATDTLTSAISGTSNYINVGPAVAPHFVVTATPSTVTAGSPVSYTVAAEDQNGNTFTGYAGTVHFTSTDSAATAPANSTLTSGVGTFNVTLKTAGNQTLSATDTLTSGITGTSNAVTVSPAAATHLALTGMPANIAAGNPFNVTVIAQDQFNNTATAYNGTVHIVSSDSQAVLPASATLTSGVGTISVTLKTAGSQSLTAAGSGAFGFFQASVTPIPGDPSFDENGAVGDFTGNGVPDLAVPNPGYAGSVSILLGNGDGTFKAPVNYALAYSTWVAEGDFTGNGILDLAVTTINSSNLPTVSVLLGNGSGTFGPATNYLVSNVSGSAALAVAVGDFTGDGKLDLAVTYQATNGPCDVAILLGNGNGTFGPARYYDTGGSDLDLPESLYLGDFNNDGKLDLVVVNDAFFAGGVNMLSVLLGNGNGTFAAATSYALASRAEQVAVGDFTGNGNLDLAVTILGPNSKPSNTVSVLLGNGNGTFGAVTNYSVGSGPVGIAAADLNGDGKLDLAVTNLDSNTGSVLLGNGNGTFGSAQNIQLGSNGPYYVAVADFNGDGLQDLAVVNVSSTTLINRSVTILLQNNITVSATVSVSAAAASQFAVTAPKTATAGSPSSVTVTATDQFGNVATSYGGTVHFSSTDGQAGLPADQVLTSGVGKFTVTLKTAGIQTITATNTASSSITATSNAITVSAAAVMRYTITGAPSSITAGIAFKVTFNALDAYGNTEPSSSYRGVIQFTSSDSQAVLPGNTVAASGTTFSVTLETAGSQTLTVTSLSSTSLTANVTVTVNPAAATHLAVAAPNTITAGHPLVFIVTAEDPFNNIVTGYTGTVHFSSSGGRAILADDGTLTGGTGFFAALLETAGSQTITATDTVTGTFTGVSNPIVVSAGAFSHFGVTAPATAVTGNPFAFTVTALDAFNNPAPTYTGTVHFTSSDSGAALPANGTLTGGVGAFTATLLAPGNQTITATDTVTSSITGSATVAARGLVVSSFAPTSTGFVATFDKPFNPTQLNLYNSAVGPADVTLMGPLGAVRGSLLLDPTDTTITFVKTSTFTGTNFDPSTGLLAPGTYTATFRSASNGFKDLSGSLLDGTNSGVPGSNYVTTFFVNSTAVAVGIPSFARGPDGSQNINLPNTAGSVGIPLNLSNGAGVTSGQFTLQYNSALLDVAGVTVNSALTGATLILDPASTAGSAVIDFSSTAALSSGPVRLGGLVATVPNSAASSYKDKALLHFASASLNGGAIAALGDDAVQIVAYPGDVSGTGTYSPLDAALISGVAANLATGFAAYALLDPVIIGDPSGSGAVNSADVTLMNAMLSGRSEPQIPPVPTALTIVPTGPDPTLSLGSRTELIPFYAAPGSTAIVPVNIDTARPSGSTGMTEAILALRFDPTVSTVSAADVELGTLPSAGTGWQLTAAVNNQTGEIGIDLFSITPIQSSAGGSLVTIALHVRETAPLGSTALNIVPQVNPTGQRVYDTTVADTQGALVLHEAVPAAGTEPAERNVWLKYLTPAAVSEAIGQQLGLSPAQQPAASVDAETSGDKHAAQATALAPLTNLDLGWLHLPTAGPIATRAVFPDTNELPQAIDEVFETWVQNRSSTDYATALTMEGGVADRLTDSLADDLENIAGQHLGAIAEMQE